MATSVENRLARTNFQIMRHPQWCVFAGVAMMGTNKVIDQKNMPHGLPPTAWVDARGNRTFCREFMEKQDDKQFTYVVIHELLHFALSHMTVWQHLFKKDPEMVNRAADHVVNNLIEEVEEGASHRITEKPTVPPLCDKKYRGWSVKQVYDDLCKKHGSAEDRQKGQGTVVIGDGPMDAHVLDGDGNEVPMTDEERQQLKQQIDNALRQGQMLASKMGGNSSRTLNDLTTPKIDWKRETADFVQATCVGGEEATWKKPYKRLVSYDTYFPSMEDEMVGALVFAMDVSGSCWSYGERFLSELVSLAKTVKPSKLIILQWDVGITSMKEVPYNDLDCIATNFEQCGGGGTTVAPVADWVYERREEIQAAIILTDGDICGSWEGKNGWGVPTLWALTSGRHLAPCGKTLRLELSDW